MSRVNSNFGTARHPNGSGVCATLVVMSLIVAALFALETYRLSSNGSMTDWLPLIWLGGALVILALQAVLIIGLLVTAKRRGGGAAGAALIFAAIFAPIVVVATVGTTLVYAAQH